MKTKNKAILVALALIIFGTVLSICSHVLVHGETKEVERKYDIEEQFDSLEVKNSSGRIEIESSDSDCCQIIIEGDSRYSLEDYEIKDGVLVLDFNYDSAWWDVTPYVFGREITIKIPNKHYEEIKVSSASGRVSVEDLRTSELTVYTGSGRIELEDVIADAQLSLKSASGRILFDEVDSPNIEIKAASGRVEGSLLSGKIFNVKTGSGRVDVPQNSNGGICNVLTGSGSVQIRIKSLL